MPVRHPIQNRRVATLDEVRGGISVEAIATGNAPKDSHRRLDMKQMLGYSDGAGLKRVARITLDPSGNINHRAIGAKNSSFKLPANAIITAAYYQVKTTFTSATDAATIALKLENTGDVLAAIAISDATNMWDAGIHGCKIGYPNLGADAAHDTQVEVAALFAGTFLRITTDCYLTATVAVEALTAGKAIIFLEYVIGA